MTPGFKQLLNRFAMLGFERQLALFDLVGDASEARFNVREGTATLAPGHTYPMQLLGTRADESNTWLWAWANEGGPVPAKALEAAKKVKQTGKKRSIGELAVEALPLDEFDFDAHTLALIATQVAGLPAYWRFPYKGGALFAALEVPESAFPQPSLERLAHVVREVVDRFELDHKVAFTSYLETRGAKVEGTKTQSIARFPDGKSLTATFDEQGRLTNVTTSEERGASSGEGAPAR